MDRSATGFENYANQSISCTVNTQAEHTQAKTRLMCEHMQTSSCSCVYESMKYLRLRVVDCTNTSLRSYKVRWRTFLEYEYYINCKRTLFLLDIFYRGSVPFLPFPIVPWCVPSKRYSWHERKANGTFSWSEIERTLILGSWELWEGECRNARAQLFNTWHGSKMNFHRF